MREQLKYVQILRGFAAMAVVLFHLDGFTLSYLNHSLFHFSYGIMGIDFFFVLTGFIITYIHLKETQHHGSVKKFLLKRFVRVYPLYWVVLVLIIGLESPEFYDKPSLGTTINPATPEGLVNIIKNIVLFPLPDSSMPVGLAWGLSHAIAFYLLFALGIKLGWGATKIILVIWLTTVLLYSFHVFPKSLTLETVAGAVNIQIIAGCSAGYLFYKNGLQLRTSAYILLLSVAALTTLVLFANIDNTHILFTTSTGIIFSSLLYCAASLDRQKSSRKPYKNYAPPILVLTGDAAYSIFLLHMIFIPYLCIAFKKVVNVQVVPDFFMNVLVVVLFFLTIIAGIATYLLVERPLLNFLRKQFRLRRHNKSWI